MHDIKYIRENPEAFDAAMQKRGLQPIAKEILSLDSSVREEKTTIQNLQKKVNDLSKQIGIMKSKGDSEASKLIQEVEGVKIQISEVNQSLNQNESKIFELLTTNKR